MKSRGFILLGRSHMSDRPVRTLITVVGIAIGVSVSVAIRTANEEVLNSFANAVTSVAGQATLQVTGGDGGFDEQYIVALRSHPAVRSATPLLRVGGLLVGGEKPETAVEIFGMDLLEAPTVKAFTVSREEDETRLLDHLTDPTTLLMGKELAKEQGITVGSRVKVVVGTRTHTLFVRGFIRADSGVRSVWDRVMIMDIAATQYQFDLLGRLDRIDLVTNPSGSVEEIAGELQAMMPPGIRVERPSARTVQVERMLRAFQFNLAALSAVGLLVGLFLVYNTVSFSVVKRYREIGLYRALGMGRGTVLTVFLLESALIGTLGGIVGGVIGLLGGRTLVSFLSQSVSELYVSVPLILNGFEANMLTVVGESGLLGMGVSMVGAFVPSLDASQTEPVKALAPGQYHESQRVQSRRWAVWGVGCGVCAYFCSLLGPIGGIPLFGYLAAFLLLISCSFMIPALLQGFGALVRPGWWTRSQGRAVRRLAIDQVARSLGRNSVTVAALMMGVAIMIGVGIMIQSFRATVENWIDQTIMADVVIAPAGWLVGIEGSSAHRITQTFAEEVRRIPGVAAVDFYRTTRVTMNGRVLSIVARDLPIHAKWSRYLFLSGESSAILRHTQENHGVIISEVLARTLHLNSGDQLNLDSPSGPHSFPIMGVFYDYATDGGKVVMDQALYRQLWNDNSASVLPVYLKPGMHSEGIREAILDRVGGTGALVVIKNRDIKKEILDIFDRTFTVTYALQFIAVAIAMLGIANTVLSSILERQRELATIRAIGGSRSQVRSLVLWETWYLGWVGAAVGLIAGMALSVLLIEVINRQSFGWTIRMMLPAELLGESVVLALSSALLAGVIPALWASRQPIIEGLRYE